MNYRCKCRSCGKILRSGDAYRHIHVTSGGNKENHYYCNEDEYLEIERDKEYRRRTLAKIQSDILEYDDRQILPQTLIGDISKLGKRYGYEVVYKCIEDNFDDLHYWMSLEDKFNNEFAKCRYMYTIIANNINDTYNDFRREQRVKEKQEESTGVDIDILALGGSNKQRKAKTDISSFLD